MGCWLLGAGELEVVPAPDKKLIEEYIAFSNETNPYSNMDEHFSNPWFFNENYKLESIAGKFGEPSIWYNYIKDFFERKGYQLLGEKKIVGEYEKEFDFWELSELKYKKYQKWIEQMVN